MLVDINKLSPNPYRDFDLYPYGEDQITKLTESYERDGDWGVLPARPHPDRPNTYQDDVVLDVTLPPSPEKGTAS